jgi:putative N6-adenine-specific DNA methylase
MANSTRSRFDVFASTAPGLESITAGELKSLGMRGKQDIGGVSFAGNLTDIYRANLWLRTASRVVVRLGGFHASTFYELERRCRKLPWTDFLPTSGNVAVRATCRKSRLYHSDAVAERVLAAIARVAPAGVNLQPSTAASPDDETDEVGRREDERPTQLFIVRIVHDEVEISADSSGALLHRRGYRKEVAKAPLRETLAAAMLLASGWQKNESLLDPLCGSGTIPIEAALLARGIAPGLARDFQFANWPGFDRNGWEAIVDEARQSVTDTELDIRGSDRDAGAIEAATRNAERAGVAENIIFSVDSISTALAKAPEPGVPSAWVVTNPPYGIRVGDQSQLRDLYATISSAITRNPAWRLGVLTADAGLARQLRIPIRSRFDSRNGGIPVSFLVSEKPKGAAKRSSASGVGAK